MKRCIGALGFLAFALLTLAQEPTLRKRPEGKSPAATGQQAANAANQGDEQEPPEEDADLRPKDYTFNPLQAEKEMRIGAFYFKRGSFRAAMLRFDEATKWNPGLAEAWRRLGEAREKLEDNPGAVEAYRKFAEIAPEGKPAADAKKRIASLSKKK